MGIQCVLAALFLLVTSITFIPRDCQGANITSLNFTIRNYFSDVRYESNPHYKQRARDFIVSQFKAFGLQPEMHQFKDGFHNIIGVLKGSNIGTAADKPVGVGAHYDTFRDKDDITAGVDDNGSGMAAMLEVAENLTDEHKQGKQRKNTILFVAFDLEEGSYAGSKNFTTGWLNPWLERIYGQAAPNIVPYGMIVMDTVMNYNLSPHSQDIPGVNIAFPTVYDSIKSNNFKGDFILNIYRANEDRMLGNAFTNAWEKISKPDFRIEVFPLPSHYVKNNAYDHFLRSDHSSLWSENFPAIFLTDSADMRGIMKTCYHKTCDNIENMLTNSNLKFLSHTVDAIVETIKTLDEIYCEPVALGLSANRGAPDLPTVCQVETTKNTTTNGCQPVSPAALELITVLVAFIGGYVFKF